LAFQQVRGDYILPRTRSPALFGPRFQNFIYHHVILILFCFKMPPKLSKNPAVKSKKPQRKRKACQSSEDTEDTPVGHVLSEAREVLHGESQAPATEEASGTAEDTREESANPQDVPVVVMEINDDMEVEEDAVVEDSPVEVSDAEDFVEASQVSQATKKKRAKPTYVRLPQEVQDELVTWIQDHEHLYIKGHARWKDYAGKRALWQEKAESLNLPDVTGADLIQWYRSMRTMFVRIHKTVNASGSGSQKPISAKDKWLLNSFQFLIGHVVTQVKRRPVKSLKPQALAQRLQAEETEEQRIAEARAAAKKKAVENRLKRAELMEPPPSPLLGDSEDILEEQARDQAGSDCTPATSGRSRAPTDVDNLFTLTKHLLSVVQPHVKRPPVVNAFGQYVTEVLAQYPDHVFR
jgi:hypothetical protein